MSETTEYYTDMTRLRFVEVSAAVWVQFVDENPANACQVLFQVADYTNDSHARRALDLLHAAFPCSDFKPTLLADQYSRSESDPSIAWTRYMDTRAKGSKGMRKLDKYIRDRFDALPEDTQSLTDCESLTDWHPVGVKKCYYEEPHFMLSIYLPVWKKKRARTNPAPIVGPSSSTPRDDEAIIHMAETHVPDPVCHDAPPLNQPHLKIEMPQGQVGYFTFSPMDPESLDFKAVKMKQAKPHFTISVYDAIACPECETSSMAEHFAYRELVGVVENAPETAPETTDSSSA